jgi:hypothetical protein
LNLFRFLLNLLHANLNNIHVFYQQIIHGFTPNSRIILMSRMWNLLAVVVTMLAVPTIIVPAFANSKSDAAFVQARNAEIDASMARVEAVQTAEFERERNAEIDASVAKVALVRSQEYGQKMSAKADVDFARARNAEIDASLAVANARREEAFALARNAEIDASLAAVAAARSSSDVASINDRLTTGSISEKPVPFVTSVIFQLGL